MIVKNFFTRSLSSRGSNIFDISSILSAENKERSVNKIKRMKSVRPTAGAVDEMAAILVPVVEIEVYFRRVTSQHIFVVKSFSYMLYTYLREAAKFKKTNIYFLNGSAIKGLTRPRD